MHHFGPFSLQEKFSVEENIKAFGVFQAII